MHFDNLLFILLGLAFVVLRWLAQRAANSTKQPPQEPERPPRAPAQSDEERVRRFMEALGNPVGSKPPPKVAPRPTMTEPRSTVAEAARKAAESARKKRTVWANPLPPLKTAPPPEPVTKHAALAQSASTPLIERRSVRPLSPVMATQRDVSAAAGITRNVQTLLSAPDGLRNAVILREILGPPRGFEPVAPF